MDTDRKKKIISSGRVTAEDLKKGDIDPNKSYIFEFENKDQKKTISKVYRRMTNKKNCQN